ncbi:MAG: family transcriptional regulator [Acidobacteriaceae bacterium]|nr:family transcriptional regulator [Acidobacteriaceae bacterium]
MRPESDIPIRDIAERVQSILACKNLSLYRVSLSSASLYGHSSPYFLPHNLYYDLRRGAFTPSIYQVAALSHITGFRLTDWLRVFGFRPEEIPRLQIALPSKRTILLNSSLEDTESWIRWFEDKDNSTPVPSVAPLAQLLQFASSKRLGSLAEFTDRGFLYARIGNQDALAFPEVIPGSIVRVNPGTGNDLVTRRNGTISTQIFLVEHGKGLYCCRLRAMGNSLLVPVSPQLSYAQVELQFPEQARVLGVVDLEIRPLLRGEEPEVPNYLAKQWKAEALVREPTVAQLLRSSRNKMNLSLREASTLSRQVVELLGDQRYFVSPSSLSDYEVRDTPPRHFHKTVTLCLVYGLQFNTFLRTFGIDLKTLGLESIPDYLVPRPRGPSECEHLSEKSTSAGFLAGLLAECIEVPFFLRNSIEAISSMSNISLHDFFWTGGQRNALHPYLENALLVLVNRRKRIPVHFRSKPVWQQPLYVLLQRDGTYSCACCGIENGNLVVHPYSTNLYRPTQLRYPEEVEVVGQIVAIVRNLR